MFFLGKYAWADFRNVVNIGPVKVKREINIVSVCISVSVKGFMEQFEIKY